MSFVLKVVFAPKIERLYLKSVKINGLVQSILNVLSSSFPID